MSKFDSIGLRCRRLWGDEVIDNAYCELKSLNEAIIMARLGKICYANDAALKLLGADCIGEGCKKYFGDDFLAGGIALETVLNGRSCSAVSADCGDMIQIILSPSDEDAVPVNPSLLSSMRNNLMTLGLLSEQLRKKGEAECDDELRLLSSGLTGIYFKMRRNIGNLEIVAGNCTPNPVVADLSLHIEELIGTVKTLFSSVSFTFRSSGSMCAAIDTVLFDRMILNLISNCIGHNSSCTAVSISMHSTSTHILISVTDNGDGMSDSDMQNAFDNYRTQSAAPMLHDGAGYGLGAVRRIARLHGGTVMLNSGDSGTSVTVSVRKADARTLKEGSNDKPVPMDMILMLLSDCIDEKYFSGTYTD